MTSSTRRITSGSSCCCFVLAKQQVQLFLILVGVPLRLTTEALSDLRIEAKDEDKIEGVFTP